MRPAAANTAEARLCGPSVPFLRWPLGTGSAASPRDWVKPPDCNGRRELVSSVARDLGANLDLLRLNACPRSVGRSSIVEFPLSNITGCVFTQPPITQLFANRGRRTDGTSVHPRLRLPGHATRIAAVDREQTIARDRSPIGVVDQPALAGPAAYPGLTDRSPECRCAGLRAYRGMASGMMVCPSAGRSTPNT
jgi:hypothetical protein